MLLFILLEIEIDWSSIVTNYLFQLPATVVVILGISFFVYKKIIEPRLIIKNEALKLKMEKDVETEASNKEISKFNEEAEWKKTVIEGQKRIAEATEKQNENIDSLSKAIQLLAIKDANNLTMNTIEDSINSLFMMAMYKLIEVCMYCITNNNIKNEQRKKSIINSIVNANTIEFDSARRFLSKIYYKNKSLDTYMISIDNEHKEKFMKDINDIIFGDYDNKNNLIQDLINYIKNHYKQHIADALLFISKF